MILVLLIKKEPVIDTWETVEKDFKRDFPNRSYLEGFCEGYCFGRHRLLTLKDFQDRLNKSERITETHYVIFVTYDQEDNEED